MRAAFRTIAVVLASSLPVCSFAEEDAQRARRTEILRHGNEYVLQTVCMPQTGEPHPDPLPFPLEVLDAEMRLTLLRLGVPIIRGSADERRSLGFAACVWKDERGYSYYLTLAPLPWHDDPPVDVEEVGRWPHVLGRAKEVSLRRALLHETRTLAREFAQQYKRARGRTRG